MFMPTYKELRVLADTLVENVTRDSTSWKEFLDSASYTYAYSFANQLLIHGQRPGVTAVATMEYWNRKAQRWVSRGSRGIAILDTHTERSRLRYVFAIEDTHANVSVPEAMPWAVTDTNRSELITRLCNLTVRKACRTASIFGRRNALRSGELCLHRR